MTNRRSLREVRIESRYMRPLHELYLTIAYSVEVPIMEPVLLRWHFGEMRPDAERCHLLLPDEMAREDCLRPDIAAPDLVTVKDFIHFYIATSTPKLTNKPTVDSINTVAECFFAGFTRVTGIDTDDAFNLPLIVRVYCWTAVRLLAFFTNGFWYRDVELVLHSTPVGRWRLIYKIDQRWVKNNRDPENIVLGIAGREHERFIYDMGFLLIMVMADQALFGYDTFADSQEQEIPAGQDELVLPLRDSVLDKPIFRKCTKADGVTDEPMPKSAITYIFHNAFLNAGYLCAISIHTIRRQLGKKVDELYAAELSAGRRLESWRRDRALRKHIDTRIERQRWPLVCVYPLCDTRLSHGRDPQFHFPGRAWSQPHMAQRSVRIRRPL
ncbi:MAG: hypothetical protein LQ341_003997 [Variospora aurantia]|nr:MAG: hypothetical protein LQ341_003997 [Variospora aurantia]